MELWVKKCAKNECSIGLCMSLRALGTATVVLPSGTKHRTRSITTFAIFDMSQLAITFERLWPSLRDSLCSSLNFGKIFDRQ